MLVGQSLTPNGTCSIKQHASNNSDSATNSESLSPCPFLLLATSCTNGEAGGPDVIGIQQELPEGCVAFPPNTGDEVCLECTAGPLTFIRPQG